MDLPPTPPADSIQHKLFANSNFYTPSLTEAASVYPVRNMTSSTHPVMPDVTMHCFDSRLYPTVSKT